MKEKEKKKEGRRTAERIKEKGRKKKENNAARIRKWNGKQLLGYGNITYRKARGMPANMGNNV